MNRNRQVNKVVHFLLTLLIMFAVSIAPAQALFDAPRDKRTYFREINYIAAAFQYQKKNYNSA